MVGGIKNFGEIDLGTGSIFLSIHSKNFRSLNMIVVFRVVIVFVIEFRIRGFMMLESSFLYFLSVDVAYDGEAEYLLRTIAFS